MGDKQLGASGALGSLFALCLGLSATSIHIVPCKSSLFAGYNSSSNEIRTGNVSFPLPTIRPIKGVYTNFIIERTSSRGP